MIACKFGFWKKGRALSIAARLMNEYCKKTRTRKWQTFLIEFSVFSSNDVFARGGTCVAVYLRLVCGRTKAELTPDMIQ